MNIKELHCKFIDWFELRDLLHDNFGLSTYPEIVSPNDTDYYCNITPTGFVRDDAEMDEAIAELHAGEIDHIQMDTMLHACVRAGLLEEGHYVVQVVW